MKLNLFKKKEKEKEVEIKMIKREKIVIINIINKKIEIDI